jgi:hypothetical protein
LGNTIQTDFDCVTAGEIDEFDARLECRGSKSKAIKGFLAGAIGFVRADRIGFHDANFDVGPDGTKFGGDNANPSGIGGYAGFPRADVAEVWLDDHLARKRFRKQAGKLLQPETKTAGELCVILNPDG